MRTRVLILLIVGFVMLGIGAALLANSGEGVIYVFPFFFSGEVGFLVPFLVIVSLTTMMFFFWWANSQYPEDARFTKYQEPRKGVLKIGSMCLFCGSPMPENAGFCSSCGSRVEYGSDNNSI